MTPARLRIKMLKTLSNPGLLVICGWLCATAGLPAGVICQEADGPASFEVNCETACDGSSTEHASHAVLAIGSGPSDCSDTPIGWDLTRPGGGRHQLTAVLTLQPAPLTPAPVAMDPLVGLFRAEDVEQPRAGPLAVHLPSVLLLI